MSEPTTLISKFGFRDSDLTTPMHDEIMQWLDANLEALVQAAYPARRIRAGDVEMSGGENCPRLKKLIDDEIWIETPRPEVVERTWEYPVGDPKFIAGFVDLMAVLKIGHVWNDWCGPCDPFEHAYGELCAEDCDECAVKPGLRREEIGFEVKTSIPSLGELIRQVRFYQAKGVKNIVVVSPDIRWRSNLASQQIPFIAVPVDRRPNVWADAALILGGGERWS